MVFNAESTPVRLSFSDLFMEYAFLRLCLGSLRSNHRGQSVSVCRIAVVVVREGKERGS